ncbi:unnamed protein product [Echinostoma caproni]|uniref:CCHC-type domain-containing protein n=1 Tax=Echinostoma caproni TaxID=27848 RepID=A0A3P8IRQ5_9TREM|nr:unnamed protein product [Echinostoma caproni]
MANKRRLGAPEKARCIRCHQCGHRVADCPLKDRRLSRAAHVAASDDLVSTLIGPFLSQGSHPAKGSSIKTTARYFSVYPPPAVGPNFGFRPPPPHPAQHVFALLPTPFVCPPPSGRMVPQHMYAGFGQPRAPFAMNRHSVPHPSVQSEPVGLSFPRSAADYHPNYLPRQHYQSHPKPPRVPSGPRPHMSTRHPYPPQDAQRERFARPEHPVWTANENAYEHHFPPPKHLGSQTAPPTTVVHQQPQSTHFVSPVKQSTPNKTSVQPTHANHPGSVCPTSSQSKPPANVGNSIETVANTTQPASSDLASPLPDSGSKRNRRRNKRHPYKNNNNNSETNNCVNNSDNQPLSNNLDSDTHPKHVKQVVQGPVRGRFNCSTRLGTTGRTEADLSKRFQHMSTATGGPR